MSVFLHLVATSLSFTEGYEGPKRPMGEIVRSNGQCLIIHFKLLKI